MKDKEYPKWNGLTYKGKKYTRCIGRPDDYGNGYIYVYKDGKVKDYNDRKKNLLFTAYSEMLVGTMPGEVKEALKNYLSK